MGAATGMDPARLVGGRAGDGAVPRVHRDRARRRDLPVVHGGARARRRASADRGVDAPVIYWPFDPTVYAGLVVLYFGYALLARGAPDAQRKHTAYFLLGLLTLWVALETPIDPISDQYLDSVHMLQHVLLAFVAPPLLLLGLSPEMAGRLVRVPGLRAVTEPVPAQVIAAVIMVGWHLPFLYELTLRNEAVHVLEHLMFIASGVLLYWPIIAATSVHARWTM